MLEKDIERVLVSQEEIQAAVKRLGKQLTEDYKDEHVVVVGILRGAIMFMTDIVRAMDVYMDIDFMDVSSYGEAFESSGQVRILKDIETDIAGKNVLIVEDIIDTGQTLKHIVDLFSYRKAKSVKIVTLLDKPSRRIVKTIHPDYIGIEVPDEFLIGYGLDYKQMYRNLPYIGVLKPEVYEN